MIKKMVSMRPAIVLLKPRTHGVDPIGRDCCEAGSYARLTVFTLTLKSCAISGNGLSSSSRIRRTSTFCAADRAAKAFSDPKRYADHIGQEVYDALGESLDRLETLHSGLNADRQDNRRVLDELVRQEETVLQSLRDDQAQAARWIKRVPLIAIFGLVLVLGLTIALPRFIAVNSMACAVLGGEWLKANASGRLACVFFGR